MHRVILAAKSKQGLPKGRAQVWLGGEGLLLWVQGEVQLGRWGALVFFLLFFFLPWVDDDSPLTCCPLQRSMAIKSTSQRRTLLEEPVEASLAMRCCCRRPKRRPHADALAAHKPTTVDDDMPFSTPEEEAPRCLPISPLSPWKLSWDLFQLVCV